jgi:hypothetical protein
VKLDEDLRSSSSQVSPSKIKESVEVHGGREVRLGRDMPSPSTLIRRKLRQLTQTLQDAPEHVGVPRSSMRASIYPRSYANQIA